MPWGAIASVAGPIIGGLFSSNSASKAADTQSAASQEAIAEQQREYNTSRSDLAPYRQAGSAALDRLRSLLGINDGQTTTDATSSPLLRNFNADDLNSDPIYKSALDFSTNQGERAINARAAAGGGYDSGATLKALARFDQGNASSLGGDAYSRFVNNQNNQYGRLSGIAGMGQGATNTGVSAGSNSASNISGLISGQGNAAGAATIAGGNAIAGGFNSAANNYGQYQLLSQLTGGGQRTIPNPTEPIQLSGPGT